MAKNKYLHRYFIKMKMANEYRNQAGLMLQNSFPRISCDAIRAILRFSENKFTSAYHLLTNIESHRSTIDGDGTGKGYFEEIPSSIKVFLKSKRPKKVFQVTNQRLCGEIDGIPELNTKESGYIYEIPKQKAPPVIIDLISDDELDGDDAGEYDLVPRQRVDVEHAPEAQVPETECLCCYGEYPLVDMMECKSGSEHFVCKQCINHFVSEQLDGNDCVTFKCIVDHDCVHEYSNVMLDKDGVLSPRLKGRMDDRVFREMVKQAGLGDEWTCPECAYLGFIDRQYPWIECPQCSVQYCTSCNDTYHEGKTCEDVRQAKARLKDPKHRAHEAMSQACKRFCPHCNQEYVKSDGCNKIKCKCGEISCYLCGEKIEGYSHFSNGPDSCPLWTSTEEMEKIDRARRQEAGRKFLVEEGITDNTEIDSILASPKKAAGPVIPPTQAGILPNANIPDRNVNDPPVIAPRAINREPAGVVQGANQPDLNANGDEEARARIQERRRGIQEQLELANRDVERADRNYKHGMARMRQGQWDFQRMYALINEKNGHIARRAQLRRELALVHAQVRMDQIRQRVNIN